MWQFIILVIIAIVTIIVSIIIYFKQRNRKKLSYEILSNTALLTLEEETKNDIQLSYKGTVVEGVKFLLLRIFNSGNLPIVSADYDKPIRIEFGKETQVLTAEVIKKNPPNLQSMITIEDRVVTLFPTLLNPEDSITIKMLVTKYEEGLQVNSRIIGVSRIELAKENSGATLAIVVISITLAIWGFGSVIWSFLFNFSFIEAFSYFGAFFYFMLVISLVVFLAHKGIRRSFTKHFGDFIKENDSEREKDNYR